jgi:hypothetical protein
MIYPFHCVILLLLMIIMWLWWTCLNGWVDALVEMLPVLLLDASSRMVLSNVVWQAYFSTGHILFVYKNIK